MINFNTIKNIAFTSLIMVISTNILVAQDKLKEMPDYERYQEIAPKIRNSVKSGALSITWNTTGNSFEYNKDGKRFQYTIKSGKAKEIGIATQPDWSHYWDRPQRGRQYASADSPNGKLKAFTKDRNMYISDTARNDIIAITSDGNTKNQIKYGIATWVYGEELDQTTAMWWSPDSKKIAFYKFNEKTSKKYYVLYNQTKIQDSVEIEAYPKVGAKNLPVDLVVYDLETKKTIILDTRNGKPYHDGDLGTYLYDIAWSPDGKELLFHSTNRKQNIMEYKAADPITGKTSVVIREEWLPSFTVNSPEIHHLKDGKRFIWASERSGYKNYYLYDFSGKLIKPLTHHNFEVSSIVKVDEQHGKLYYMARSGDNHMKMQLHCVRLNGSKDIRLTDPAYHHTISLSPNNNYIVDVAQTHDKPPFTNLLNSKGKIIKKLATSDVSEFEKLGLKKVEVFTFTSADKKTELHGMLHFPSNFDPTKKYPVLLSIYGGPSTHGFRETFKTPDALTEFGFLVVNLDGRNVGGRGKRLLDQLYGNFGIVEMDDFAEGIMSLYDRPYFDKDKVGVFGTSYGGTTAATSLLRFPEVYHAAVANSAVTDWRNYDNIYTERFMNTIEDNKAGYDAGSVMKYVDNLKGDLMIFYGTSDNNVHPSNSLQLIQALQKAGKSFEVQVGPDKGHAAMNRDRMMEFFIESLVLKK